MNIKKLFFRLGAGLLTIAFYGFSAAGAEAATLTVTSPNGGETVIAGDRIAVTWSSIDVPPENNISIALRYVSNGGVVDTFLSNMPNDGMEIVGIPSGMTLGSYMIVINTDVNGQFVTDTSDSNFTIKGSGSLAVSRDPSSIGYQVVAAGTTGVELLRLRFSAMDEAVSLRQVAFQLSGTAFNTANDLSGRRITLWDGATLIGEAVFMSDYATSSLISNFIIPKDGSKTMIIKGDIAGISLIGPITASGDLLKVDYDGDNVGINGTYGVGWSSGSIIMPFGADTTIEAANQGVKIFRGFPTFASVTGWQASSLSNGNQPLMRFSVKANGGDVGLYKLTTKITGNPATLSDVNIYVYTDIGYSNPVSGVNVGGRLSSINGNLSNETKILEFRADQNGTEKTLIIPAQSTYYFEVRGTVSGVTSGSGFISTQLEGDDLPAPAMTTASAMEGYTASNDLIWTPNSLSVSGLNAFDFSNGYLLPGLPATNMNPQVLANSSPSPTPVPTPISRYINVSTPNGGEKWVPGQTYDITWTQQNIDMATIYLMRTSSLVEATIASNLIVPINASTYTYSYTVPANTTVADTYKIWIIGYQTGVGQAQDMSDVSFSVIAVPVEPPPVSTKFQMGDKVQTTTNLKTRSCPSNSCRNLGVHKNGDKGTVIGGPVQADGFIWWNINYATKADGWSAENWLIEIAGSVLSAQVSLSETIQILLKQIEELRSQLEALQKSR